MVICIVPTFPGRKTIIIRNLTQSGENLKYPCFILGFIKCTAFMKSSTNSDPISTNGTEFTLLKVIPLQENHQRNYYPQPVEVWRMPNPDFFNYVFLPLSYILCQCAYSVFVGDSTCLTVVLCNRYSSIV